MTELNDLHPMDQFYLAFGKAMATWGEVEYGLSLWFTLATGLNYEVAKDLFFSGKSFSTRSDLLGAALDPTEGGIFPATPSKVEQHWLDFAVAARNKAGSYSGVRNRLAHGVMHPNRAPGGSTEWRLKEPAEWQRREGYTITQMRVIARNFSELSSILRMSFLGEQRQESPAPFAKALLELPNETDCAEPSEKQKLAISNLPPN
jgi:hypothetical protein